MESSRKVSSLRSITNSIAVNCRRKWRPWFQQRNKNNPLQVTNQIGISTSVTLTGTISKTVTTHFKSSLTSRAIRKPAKTNPVKRDHPTNLKNLWLGLEEPQPPQSYSQQTRQTTTSPITLDLKSRLLLVPPPLSFQQRTPPITPMESRLGLLHFHDPPT